MTETIAERHRGIWWSLTSTPEDLDFMKNINYSPTDARTCKTKQTDNKSKEYLTMNETQKETKLLKPNH